MGRLAGLALACSRRSDSGARAKTKASERSPLVFFPLFRSLYFSLALHYLNAWNRLGWPGNRHYMVNFQPVSAARDPGNAIPAGRAEIFPCEREVDFQCAEIPANRTSPPHVIGRLSPWPNGVASQHKLGNVNLQTQTCEHKLAMDGQTDSYVQRK